MVDSKAAGWVEARSWVPSLDLRALKIDQINTSLS